jgi:Domain of unknown function (DUF222)
MQRLAGTSVLEGYLIDWVAAQPIAEPCVPVAWLTDAQVAAELDQLQRDRARQLAREAELVLRLAALRPDDDDPPPGARGARSRTWRRTEPEFPGVSEFLVPEVAHAINLGRGTAAFRVRRAYTWRDKLPKTFALLRRGRIDERRAGVLAEVLQNVSAELAQAVETLLLPEACDLSPGRLEKRALELLAELDGEAADERREVADENADVFVQPSGDGRATIGADLPADQAAEAHSVIDQLAAMAKADGDDRPIGQIRTGIYSLLLRCPGGSGLPQVRANLTVTAELAALEGTSAAPGDVNGFVITAAHLRDLLRRIGALGLTEPDDGTLSFAITDSDGRLLATLTAAELQRLARRGCSDHPGGDCGCAVLGPPPPTDAYEPTDKQRAFVTTRDRTCRMANCGQRVGWADLDHVCSHASGGPTACENLCCLCRSHHRLKTFARGWTFVALPDGRLRVTSPSGITRTTRPPGLRPPLPPPIDPASDPPPF